MLRVISSSKYSYSAVLVNFPDIIANRIKNWCKNNVAQKDVSTKGDAKGRETQIHCTAKFGLHTDNAEEIKEALDEFGKFSVSLGLMSRFTKPDDLDVLKIEIESKRLGQMHKILSELPNSDKFTEYKPHATISYIDKGSNYEFSGNDTFCGEKFEVGSVIFSPVIGQKAIIKL